MIERCYRAALVISAIFALFYVPLIVGLQFSIYLPITSGLECYSIITSSRLLLSLLLQVAIISGQSLMLSIWIFSVKYETNFNIAKYECLVAFGIIFTGHVLTSFVISITLIKEPIWTANGSLALLWLTSTIASALYCAYTTNFQLRFLDKSFHELRMNINALILMPALDSAIQLLKLFGLSWLISLNFAILFRPLHSSILSLLAFWKLFDFYLLLFSCQVTIWITPFVANFFIMTPIEFLIPTVFYAAADGLTGTAVTLIQALESNNPIIRLIGLRQLQKLCCGTSEQRKPFYELSQPGGHPRNWHSLRDLALTLVRELNDRIEHEAHCKTVQMPFTGFGKNGGPANKSLPINEKSDGSALMNSSSGSAVLNELFEAKKSFFIPPTLKPRTADAFSSERMCSHRILAMPLFMETFVEKLKHHLLVSPPIIKSYDTLCSLHAIRALASVIANSLAEDKFGVVQKDLKRCLSSLTRLSIAIDAYVRVSGNALKSSTERNIYLLDAELARALKSIRDVLGPHMRCFNRKTPFIFQPSELDLHPTELEVFQVLN